MKEVGTEESLEAQDSLDTGSEGARQMFDREDNIKINFSKLDQELKEFTEEEAKKEADRMAKEVQETAQTIDRIAAPNLKAGER